MRFSSDLMRCDRGVATDSSGLGDGSCMAGWAAAAEGQQTAGEDVNSVGRGSICIHVVKRRVVSKPPPTYVWNARGWRCC